MKKSVLKTIATLTLALTLVMTGAVTADAANDGIMVIHDFPFFNRETVN